jgi:Domain of unknown function (DUF397)
MTSCDGAVAEWLKSSFSQNGDCVEIAFKDKKVLVRDSKRPHESFLIFTSSEWSAFLAGVRNGEFDQS